MVCVFTHISFSLSVQFITLLLFSAVTAAVEVSTFWLQRFGTSSISVLCGHGSSGRCPHEAAANDSTVQVAVVAVAAAKTVEAAVMYHVCLYE